MKKLKIAIFTGYFLPNLGGVERYTDKLCEQLKKMGNDIYIVTSQFNKNLTLEDKNEYGVIYRLPIYNIFKNRYPIIKKNGEFKNILNKLRRLDIDVVICQTRFHLTTLIGLKYAKEKDISSIVIEHGSSHFTVNNNILDFFGRIYEHILTFKVKKLCSNFYGVSNKCNEWLTHFNIEAKGIFYNSVSCDDYDIYRKGKLKLNSINIKNKIVISYAGRLIKEKGVLMLITAVNQILKTNDQIVLLIAGDGPEKNNILKLNNNNIHYIGKLEFKEVMNLYNMTDIFVYPSMFPEGLPTTILEAGLMNCAVVATDRGGTIEVIKNKKYGLISNENVEDLIDNLNIMIKNSKYRKDCQNNLHERIINEFSWNVTTKAIYSEIISIINNKE